MQEPHFVPDLPDVSMFCLESRDIMPAADDEVTEAEEEGIVVNNSWGPKEILTENGKVTAVVFKNVSLFWMRINGFHQNMTKKNY